MENKINAEINKRRRQWVIDCGNFKSKEILHMTPKEQQPIGKLQRKHERKILLVH